MTHQSEMLRQNKLGGLYVPGKATPTLVRSHILLLYFTKGETIKNIAESVQLTPQGVSKIIQSYFETKSLIPKVPRGPDHTVVTGNVLRHIEFYKTKKPSIYAREIRDKLARDGVCDETYIPSARTIAHVINKELIFTRKRLSVLPEESLTPAAVEKQHQFFEEILPFQSRNIHFMDEASVIRPSGNRRYGHAYTGEPAAEVCRYSSDANFTVNLLCSMFGIDHYNILEGPSNGLELLQFFEDALEQRNDNGNPVLAEGDVVVLDNCGFHHARHVEPILREMLLEHGVTLLFQPPYCPELNPCEYCFAHMKSSLKRNEMFTARYTELAIVYAMELITPAICYGFVRHCGYTAWLNYVSNSMDS